jgi:hypothetical protein
MYFLKSFGHIIPEHIQECPGDAAPSIAAMAPGIVAGPRTVVVCHPDRSEEVLIAFTQVAKAAYAVRAVQDIDPFFVFVFAITAAMSPKRLKK